MTAPVALDRTPAVDPAKVVIVASLQARDALAVGVDVSQHVREGTAVVIPPREVCLRDDTRNTPALDEIFLGFGQATSQHHILGALSILDTPAKRGARLTGQACQPRHQLGLTFRESAYRRIYREIVASRVDGEGAALAIDDRSPNGR